MSLFALGDSVKIILGVLAGAGLLAVVVWRLRRPPPNPRSAELLGLMPKPAANAADEIARLRQNLRVKVLHDEKKVERLLAAERDRLPGASELDLHRAAVERWERDNR